MRVLAFIAMLCCGIAGLSLRATPPSGQDKPWESESSVEDEAQSQANSSDAQDDADVSLDEGQEGNAPAGFTDVDTLDDLEAPDVNETQPVQNGDNATMETSIRRTASEAEQDNQKEEASDMPLLRTESTPAL